MLRKDGVVPMRDDEIRRSGWPFAGGRSGTDGGEVGVGGASAGARIRDGAGRGCSLTRGRILLWYVMDEWRLWWEWALGYVETTAGAVGDLGGSALRIALFDGLAEEAEELCLEGLDHRYGSLLRFVGNDDVPVEDYVACAVLFLRAAAVPLAVGLFSAAAGALAASEREGASAGEFPDLSAPFLPNPGEEGWIREAVADLLLGLTAGGGTFRRRGDRAGDAVSAAEDALSCSLLEAGLRLWSLSSLARCPAVGRHLLAAACTSRLDVSHRLLAAAADLAAAAAGADGARAGGGGGRGPRMVDCDAWRCGCDRLRRLASSSASRWRKVFVVWAYLLLFTAFDLGRMGAEQAAACMAKVLRLCGGRDGSSGGSGAVKRLPAHLLRRTLPDELGLVSGLTHEQKRRGLYFVCAYLLGDSYLSADERGVFFDLADACGLERDEAETMMEEQREYVGA